MAGEILEVIMASKASVGCSHLHKTRGQMMTITPLLIDQFMTFLKCSIHNVDFFLQEGLSTFLQRQPKTVLSKLSGPWISLAREMMKEWDRPVTIHIHGDNLDRMPQLISALQSQLRVPEGEKPICVYLIYQDFEEIEDGFLRQHYLRILHQNRSLQNSTNPALRIAFLDSPFDFSELQAYSLRTDHCPDLVPHFQSHEFVRL